MGTTSVRRNLFHHHLSRRPISAAAPNPLAQDGSDASKFQPHMLKPSSAESVTSTLRCGPVDNGEIVVRDKNGSYELDIPALPPTIGSEDGDEMSGVNEARVGGGAAAAAAATDSTGETEISGQEKESTSITLFTWVCVTLT
ncbi:hypothetical protein PHISCL_06366 [Aspergillus sclerotialis]|uniref:Uncharacterized protein n=1 Tax=Aspergillus sclerotialis TaxID=2070753 RepID=A0A3A2ZIR8_9EURO|nr:hypothetical protein PHISCL_06366 [Aspergillus sclerotialis]